MRNSHPASACHTGVSAAPQTAMTASSRPEALTSRFMSSGSLVRIIAFSRTAIVTTTASTTSAVWVLPRSRPASCASLSPRGTTAHPVKKRRSCACFGDRLTWATTGQEPMEQHQVPNAPCVLPMPVDRSCPPPQERRRRKRRRSRRTPHRSRRSQLRPHAAASFVHLFCAERPVLFFPLGHCG